MAARDHYEILGVDRGASDADIRRAYRTLARRYHPDVNKEAGAAQRFQEISEAYEVLSDKQKRQAYDRFGHAGVGAGPGRGGRGPSGWSGVGAGGTSGFGDFGDIFEQVFSAKGSPFTSSGSPFAAGPRPRRGPDTRVELTVEFMKAALGGTETIQNVAGHGPQRLEVRIPPGVEPGTKLRLKGRGRPAPSGGPAGDLIVTVRVGEHPRFRRDGLDILVDVPVTIVEATLGTTVTVPLLQGSASVKVPPGASSGRKLRLKGRGITDGDGRTGDLLAVVQIVAPTGLTPRGRALLEELSAELKNPRDGGPWADSA
ncbi:MAG: DnaJ C-terminal domain-containing protein [Planctomycetota bacterium]|jgi:DnaJ-class molecular chaperone